MSTNQRREFLKKGLAGVCGAALVPGTVKSSFGGPGAGPDIPSLPSRTLGRTGLRVPLISMGTGNATSPECVRTAYESGVKLFFSATYYGMGNNERLVGEGLKVVPRDSYLIGTAAPPEGFNPREEAMPKGLTAASYMAMAEKSLKRFGLDHVDILLLPFADKKEFVLYEPILKAMAELKKQGKTRFLGIASHGSSEEAIRAAADCGVYDVMMIAYNYTVKNRDSLDKTLSYMTGKGLGIVAMKTTAGAFRDKDRKKPLNTDAALKWVLNNKDITSIVSGMSTVDELRRNLKMIGDLEMSDAEMKDLDLAALEKEPGLYCQQCLKCLPQCPNRLDIPTLMRSYMYAYGYRDAAHARYTIDTVDLSGGTCGDCGACKVKCTAGFDIKDRVQDIIRLKNVPLDFLKG